MADDMTFHESYGQVSREQLRLYRKHNVSPSDHDTLMDAYGDDAAAICAAVRRNSDDGMYREYAMVEEARQRGLL